jgi:dTDP-4-dehydrorhamnose 3,5-epimerase
MLFVETAIRGAFILEPERLEDERGFFARTWSMDEFEKHGLNPRLVQCSISFSKKRGTLRGMHFQLPPYREAKLVRCTMGAIFDVILDLRRDSPSFLGWVGHELTAENRKMAYIPEDVAHGFQTTMDDTEVFYQMSEFHHLESASGARWNDPAFGIDWPVKDVTVSSRDDKFELWRS